MRKDMTVKDVEKIRKTIEEVAIAADSYEDDFLGFYKFLSNSISQERQRIDKLGNVDFIVVENLYKDYERAEFNNNVIIQKKKRDIVNIFTFGDFQQDSQITWELSEILADFYVEYLLLPILQNINYELFSARSRYFKSKIKNGVKVYEAERCLHRDSTAIPSQCEAASLSGD